MRSKHAGDDRLPEALERECGGMKVERAPDHFTENVMAAVLQPEPPLRPSADAVRPYNKYGDFANGLIAMAATGLFVVSGLPQKLVMLSAEGGGGIGSGVDSAMLWAVNWVNAVTGAVFHWLG